jgi:hypothetical protein
MQIQILFLVKVMHLSLRNPGQSCTLALARLVELNVRLKDEYMQKFITQKLVHLARQK